MEIVIIRTLQVIGVSLILYSCYLLIVEDVLFSASGIEYGVILFGIGCTANEIRSRRALRKESKRKAKGWDF